MVPESCSCLYGNPCVDEYSCRDWTNRFAVASKLLEQIGTQMHNNNLEKH